MSLYPNYSTPWVVAAGVIASATVYNVLGRALRQYLVSKQTVLNDIPKLGRPPNRTGKIRGTAVISGGSIAGLWVARVCADHFEKVLVIEPETWISSDQNKVGAADYTAQETREHDGVKTLVNKRTRVWQYQGTHGYQPLAVIAFRKLFPRFDEVARSMNIAICPNDIHAHLSGMPLNAPRHEYPAGQVPDVLVATRASLETLLRTLVRELDACRNVHFVDGTVTGVVPSSERPNRLEGVQCRLDGQKEVEIIAGELFVDCTGPTQAFFKYLPRAGYGLGGSKPLADLRLHYDQQMKYSCLLFDLTPEIRVKLSAMLPANPHITGSSYLNEGWDKAAWLYLLHPMAEFDSKMSMGKMIGGNRVEFTFGGWGLEDPPRNKAQILEFMDSMVMAPGYKIPTWIRSLFDIICNDDSVEEPIVGLYPTPTSVYIQYHLASNLPSNFVATGDAVMELNPVFGHGCSKACIGAVTLNAALSNVRKNTLPDDFAEKFFNVQADRVIGSWNQAKGQDYQYETTKPVAGEEKEQEKLLQTQGGFMNA